MYVLTRNQSRRVRALNWCAVLMAIVEGREYSLLERRGEVDQPRQLRLI